MFNLFNDNLFQVISLFCLFYINSSLAFAQSEQPEERGVFAKRFEGVINIDGILDEQAWNNSEKYIGLIQREPLSGNPVSEKTGIYIIYDTDNLYIGVRCWDSEAELIVANEMRRDNHLFNNDAVEIFLDTYNDHRNAFYFATNPLGAQFDGILTTGLGDDQQNWDWNGVWDCSSTIDNDGWTTEIKIPFKTLRFSSAENQVWGFNISRLIGRKKEEAYLAPISRDLGFFGKYRIDVYTHLNGLENISQPEKYQLKPFTLAGTQKDFEENEPLEKVLEFGLDAKYLLTSNLTVDLTLNTDFAQVEADQEQVNLTRFELFFPEKREFFLEGAGNLRFGERAWSPLYTPTVLFFSRRIGLSDDNEIVPLIGGIKLGGKEGGYDIGFMNMLTKRTSYFNDDDEYVEIPKTNYTAFRIRKDIFSNSHIGIIGLSKESLDDKSFNRTFGLDGNFYINDNIQFSAFIAKTSTPNMPKRDLALYGDFLYGDDLLTFRLSQNSIQENFNPEMGYVPRTDTRATNLNLGLSPRPNFFDLRQIFLFNDYYYFAKQNGELESRWNYLGSWNQFQSGAYLFGMWSSSYERLYEEFEVHDDVIIPIGIYKFDTFYGEFQSDLSKPVSGIVNINFGEFYDGIIQGYGLGANLKFGTNLTVNINYNHNKIDLPYGAFDTNLLGFRCLYSFTPRMYIKAFVQWNSDHDAVVSNILFNFIHTPGSDLYIVYNEEVDTLGRKLNSKNRTILLKLTYLFSI